MYLFVKKFHDRRRVCPVARTEAAYCCAGVTVKKSALQRAGLVLIAKLDDEDLQDRVFLLRVGREE